MSPLLSKAPLTYGQIIIVFGSHPLQTSAVPWKHADSIKVVSQPPLLIELFDDKTVVNNLLSRTGGFNVPREWIFSDGPDVIKTMQEASLPFPVVAKPIRGRGSHAVKVCRYLDEFVDRARSVFSKSPQIMVEEFLAGEEANCHCHAPDPGRRYNVLSAPGCHSNQPPGPRCAL